MIRNPENPNSITGRPRSQVRLAIDAVLFTAAAGVVGWSCATGFMEGRMRMMGGAYASVADQPGLFWIVAGFQIIIALACLGIGMVAVRTLIRLRRAGRVT